MSFWDSYNGAYNAVSGIYNNVRRGQLEGEERRKQNALEAAMRGYAMNPEDPNAVNALTAADPRLGMQLRERQQSATAAKQERDAAMIAALARDAKDPVSFDAAVDQVVQMGYPQAAQFKGKFSPALRSALMAAGGVKDAATEQPTSLERNYQFYQRVKPELADKYLSNQADPVRFIPDGMGGGSFVNPPESNVPAPSGPSSHTGGGPQPGSIEDGYRFKGGDPARPENWEPVNGGPTPRASGGFPY